MSPTPLPGGAFHACVDHISEFQVSANPDVADPGSEAALFVVDHPQNQHQMHTMGFSRRPGDEGNLYIASGDGGGSCDDDAAMRRRKWTKHANFVR